ncbi:nuclear transport factor 2 family protein [Nocardioides taihuensis]|uniref:Nuclear transport factor 2 family protein n=1 Tax=Nocardioides taihuensis TaxID=1835606 RepID=A0ABW0BDZ4_9ACTN
MDEDERRGQLLRHWEFAGSDQDITHEIYAEDAVLEFPQSGERFVGVASFKPWREQYPEPVEFRTVSLRGSGDLWVVENLISYDGRPWQPTVNILEFRGDEVVRESIYITETWEAPEWRAPWRDTTGGRGAHEES